MFFVRQLHSVSKLRCICLNWSRSRSIGSIHRNKRWVCNIEIREEGKRQINTTSVIIPNQQLCLSLERTGDGVLRFDFINSEALVEFTDVWVVVVG